MIMMLMIEMKEIVEKIPGNNLLFVRARNDDDDDDVVFLVDGRWSVTRLVAMANGAIGDHQTIRPSPPSPGEMRSVGWSPCF